MDMWIVEKKEPNVKHWLQHENNNNKKHTKQTKNV